MSDVDDRDPDAPDAGADGSSDSPLEGRSIIDVPGDTELDDSADSYVSPARKRGKQGKDGS